LRFARDPRFSCGSEAAARRAAEIEEAAAARLDVLTGDAAETLAEKTLHPTDLVVMGSRGYERLGRAMLSGNTWMSECPLLVVPPAA
jgi:nucleotide-binding universal stress UspA family protein